jgi:hypothetical protein
MAVTSKALARTSAATSNATLYSPPNTSTVAVITDIVITNTSSSLATATVSVDGVELFAGLPIGANSLLSFDLKQVIPASDPAKLIEGFASTTGVKFHISGVEIS